MAKLSFQMMASLDGFISDLEGGFDWSQIDKVVHAHANAGARNLSLAVCGRGVYETMVYWETAHLEPDQPQVGIDYARVWQAAQKVVFSKTLAEVSSERTRLERTFDPEVIARWKAESDSDFSVDGPTLAAEAIRAGLVDEFGLFIGPAIVGGGKPFFPDGVHVDLELAEDRRFDSGVMFLRYTTRE